MNADRDGEVESRVAVHTALADPTRLGIVDLLAVSDASSSEIGARLGVPSNLLAHHLKVLETAGLVDRQRSEGDGRRTYLTLADHARPWAAASVPRPRRVLFVCTGNSARSHLAAALWSQASTVPCASAGTHPAERVHPKAEAAADRHGVALLPEARPRLLDDVARRGDLVVTVCDRAHEELGDRGRLHWSIPDPVPVGTSRAFASAYDRLAARIATLAPLLDKAS